MKQILQNLASGTTEVADVPTPRCKSGHLLIQSLTSLISAGTERMLVDFGRSGYLEKARQQPEKVKMVLDKVRTDGLLPTIDAIRSKLDQPIPMGYSNVGKVIEVGTGVTEYKVGDIVVSNGSHAEVVCVPKNLCAKVPEGVSPNDAVFTVVGAIALQGIRLAAPTLGESFVVTGLGLIGLMAVQLLRAQGCRVLGIDFDAKKLELAQSYGADTVNLSAGEDAIAAADKFSRGRGVDGVILTASTKSSNPVQQGATMCRKRGRIILVGVTGLELNRADFYEKELSFQVSCSYGPGRYDSSYEEGGADYPVGFVRWTEQRNFEAVLDIMSSGGLSLDALKTKEFDIDTAPQAYDLLLQDKSALGVLLSFSNSDDQTELSRTVQLNPKGVRAKSEKPVLAAVGAGNYLGRVLLPAFAKTNVRLKTIASSGGVTGTHYGKKLGFEESTTATENIFTDAAVDAVVIGTQHNSHARFTVDALEQGKSVFVEKPLALTDDELDQVEQAYVAAHDSGAAPLLMVGFNRRFAPLIQNLKSGLSAKAPMSLVYTCNAGSIDADSWVQDPERGGGRIIGEACHFIDIARFLTGSSIVGVSAKSMSTGPNDLGDTATIVIEFENRSLATIHYFANGHKSFPKERIEVFQNGGTYVLDNFRKLTGFGSKKSNSKAVRQDKGQKACCEAFVDALEQASESPIPFDELMEVSRAAIKAWKQIVSH